MKIFDIVNNVFVSFKWNTNFEKTIYSLNGNSIGIKKLKFDESLIKKRNFKVHEGCIYVHNKIIGKEHIIFNNDISTEQLVIENENIKHLLKLGYST